MSGALSIFDLSTVLPHVEAVYELNYWAVLDSPSILFTLHPTVLCLLLCIFWMASSWILSIISGNVSQVDRLWSITPWIYSWIYFFSLPYPHGASKLSLDYVFYVAERQPRFLLFVLLPTFWGLRLTYNFWRKGGYKWSDEDYRWKYVRAELVGTGLVFHLFNIFFISIYQHLLLYWIVFPIHFAFDAAIDPLSSSLHLAPLSACDVLAASLFISFQLTELIADQQQFAFYNRRTLLRSGALSASSDSDGDLARGFLASSGLFRFSRHPNFFSEQGMWWSYSIFAFQFFSLPFVNISTLGALQLSFLFQGSTDFTEKITVSKYPSYRDYQKSVSRLVPWTPKKVNWTTPSTENKKKK